MLWTRKHADNLRQRSEPEERAGPPRPRQKAGPAIVLIKKSRAKSKKGFDLDYWTSKCWVHPRPPAQTSMLRVMWEFGYRSSSDQSDVRFGSKADMCSAKRHVRFTPNSGHGSGIPINKKPLSFRPEGFPATYQIYQTLLVGCRVRMAVHQCFYFHNPSNRLPATRV